jgi:hypothetical protein
MPNETKWTPGPWQFRFFFRMIRAVRNHQTTLGMMLQPDDTRDVYDAHLIAAAPELYEALVNIVANVTSPDNAHYGADEEYIDAALAALAKARGEHAE